MNFTFGNLGRRVYVNWSIEWIRVVWCAGWSRWLNISSHMAEWFAGGFSSHLPCLCLSPGCWLKLRDGEPEGAARWLLWGTKATGCHLNPPWANPFLILTISLTCNEQQLFSGFYIVWCFSLWNKNGYSAVLSHYLLFFLMSSPKEPYLSKQNLKCKL